LIFDRRATATEQMPEGSLLLLGQLLPGNGDVVVGFFDFMLCTYLYKNLTRTLEVVKGLFVISEVAV